MTSPVNLSFWCYRTNSTIDGNVKYGVTKAHGACVSRKPLKNAEALGSERVKEANNKLLFFNIKPISHIPGKTIGFNFVIIN